MNIKTDLHRRRLAQTNSGFTMVEIMVVVAIIAAVMAVGAPKLFNTSAAMRSTVRKMAVMTREIRDSARLTGSTKRIVIDMNKEKGYSFWVETAFGNITLLTAEKQKDLERLTKIQRDDEKPKDVFAIDHKITKKPESLPRGMIVESVEIAGHEDPITEGKAYIHFFPQGLVEEAVIHFSDRKTLNWTLSINPLTGRADVFERKISLKELRNL